MLLWAFKRQVLSPACFALLLSAHLAAQREWLAAPSTPLCWALVLLGVAFGLLGLGVSLNWRLSHRSAAVSRKPSP